ncbi:MAG: sugar ABC transporter substrate-binding protein [Candidatus Hydrogenedentes bacterium]|nr:sugar ABC transporter substrate-binding protein [Candidatus Hydrogenedentota bacterium]
MKTRFLITISLLIGLLLPSACDRGPATDRPTVALVMKSLANEFFKTMEEGARNHHAAQATEYDLIVNGIKDELDVSRQVQLVEQMIAQRVNAIVIAPADSKILIPVCKRAMDAGIVVINIDNKFDADVLKEQNVKIPFVGPDNRKGARAVGEYLAKQLRTGDKVAILEGVPTAFNAQQRKLGFEDAIKAAGLMVAASQSAHWETAEANQIVSALITEQPDLKSVLCANDSMALGAVAALRAANKLGQVKVVGYDNISAVQQMLQLGEILATADQHADQLAVYGIEYALETLKTNAPPADRETPVDLKTATSNEQ